MATTAFSFVYFIFNISCFQQLLHVFFFSFIQQTTNIMAHSTIARSFSLELMDIFRIENSISDLDQQVDKRCVSLPINIARPPHQSFSTRYNNMHYTKQHNANQLSQTTKH